MVALDAGFLGLMLHPAARPPIHPNTGLPTLRAKERVEKLFDDLDVAMERILIPTPALCEFLVLAGKDAPQYINEISMQGTFVIQPFDLLAAVELAAMELLARAKGSKRIPARADAPWQKVKFYRQIVAIAKLHKAHTIFSDDTEVKTIAEDIGIKVVHCWDLSIPVSKTPLLENSEPPLEIS
jgi:hypothetical protein